MFNGPIMPDLEFQSVEDMAEVQDKILAEHVRFLSQNSPFYRRLFKSIQLKPEDIRSVGDLAKIPPTTKADLEKYNLDFLCLPEEEIVDICLTSGTTGIPVAMYQSRSDLERLGYNEEISFRAAGLTAKDRVMIAAAIDRCFMAGLAYFLGLNRIGSTVIRAGSSSIPVMMELAQAYRPTAIVGVPSLLLTLGERLKAEGIDPAGLGVKRLICIGEPVRTQDFSLSVLGQRLFDLWRTDVFGTYASTEMATAFGDCEKGRGGHVHPDLIVVELLDEAGQKVALGQPGEVVVTPLQVTGMPLLRFRTGDVAVFHEEPCPCGRKAPRLGPILGRKCQLLKYRGTSVYPPAIFSVLQEIQGIRNFYIEVHDHFDLSDHIRVVVGTEEPELSAAIIAEKIAAKVRVKPEVVLALPKEVAAKVLQENKRKPITFFDHRRRQHE